MARELWLRNDDCAALPESHVWSTEGSLAARTCGAPGYTSNPTTWPAERKTTRGSDGIGTPAALAARSKDIAGCRSLDSSGHWIIGSQEPDYFTTRRGISCLSCRCHRGTGRYGTPSDQPGPAGRWVGLPA